jgi:hypothetical protein
MNPHNKQHFITKFTALRDDEVGAAYLSNQCPLYHCGVRSYAGITEEAQALAELVAPLVSEVLPRGQEYRAVYLISDGDHACVKDGIRCESTPRRRLLAALRQT